MPSMIDAPSVGFVCVGWTTGGVGGYSTPKAFAKKGQGKNAATKQGERLGFKTVERPKRPSNTKMFTYLDENK